ncbi:MAG: hypothetical protein JXA72_02390 [Bacteroidales bacterium]|nr:hypothetical protein [Bacteroidales bacterium]
MLSLVACLPMEDPPKETIDLQKLNNLPELLNENSGMTAYDDLIWFINDGGNDSAIYGYKQSARTVERSVAIRNSSNVDWEDITQNEEYLFIGDFGNNASGNRNDLKIYMISKSDLTPTADTIVPAGIIHFQYEDQTDFSPVANNTTSFDCEAFIATEDSIVLFAKDWLNEQTRLYTLPLIPGNHVAKLRKQWNVNGLVTSAAWSADEQVLYLLGYTSMALPFLTIWSGFDSDNLTYSEVSRTEFSNLMPTQAEGIAILPDASVLISSEAFTQISNMTKSPELFVVDYD